MQQCSQRMRLPKWSSKNSDSEAETVVEPPEEPKSMMSNYDIETGAQMPHQDVENGDVGPSTLMASLPNFVMIYGVFAGNHGSWKCILTPTMKFKTKSSCSHQTHIAQLQSHQSHFSSVVKVDSTH
jgi:hypothetical protein